MQRYDAGLLNEWKRLERDDGLLHVPELSDKWKCSLFGGTESYGILWIPLKGKEPNWFWRWMQYICFGNKWKKTDK